MTDLKPPFSSLARLATPNYAELAILTTAIEAAISRSAADFSSTIAADWPRNSLWVKALQGPLHDIQHLAPAFAFTKAAEQSTPFIKVLESLDSRFRLPVASELSLQGGAWLQFSKMTDAASSQSSVAIHAAMEQMRTPWLDASHALASTAAFADLQILGNWVDTNPAFANPFTDKIRTVLGDWRDSSTISPTIAADIAERTSAYHQLGFDSRLTDFPAPAFDQSTVIARLKQAPPKVIALYDFSIPARDAQEEEGYQRTNEAHDRLLRFETHLRRFIDERMTGHSGTDWVKHRVPQNIHERWREKFLTASKHSQSAQPLIAYADFTDYEPIISRKDNWNEVFKPVFNQSESLRESLQRLYPVRLATMHARLITQDDQLLLYIETKRILKAIGSAR
jgi:Swt1-like HEPN